MSVTATPTSVPLAVSSHVNQAVPTTVPAAASSPINLVTSVHARACPPANVDIQCVPAVAPPTSTFYKETSHIMQSCTLSRHHESVSPHPVSGEI